MRTPEQVRERLAVMWRRQWTEWLGGAGEWPKGFPLDPPTERAAQARWPEFTRWAATWSTAPLGGTVAFATKSWATMGVQRVPTHVSFANAAEIAAALGQTEAGGFDVASRRWSECAAAWPDVAQVLRGQADWLAGLPEADYRRFVDVVNWTSANPDSGLFVRQLPVPGLDSKWIERHAGQVARTLGSRLGRTGPLHLVAGLATDPPRRRMRILDPGLRAMMGGVSDLSLRIDELGALQLPIRVALVIENQQTALACEDLPGAVVLMGGGFAVTELGSVPWLRKIPLLYWGDIDTAGFAILSALRAHHPQTVSCLMDERTLLAHRDLWSDDEALPRGGPCASLFQAERMLLVKLTDGHWRKGVRLEQERIPWALAWPAVREVAASQLAGRLT